MPALDLVSDDAPALRRLVTETLAAWPDHDRFLTRRFEGGVAAPTTEEGAHAELLAEAILRLAGDTLPTVIGDYQWMCARVLEEELHFRRTGGYRRTSFAEALTEVYQNREYMGRYMNGLLLSQVLWGNHTAVSAWYDRVFLGNNPPGHRHLEVGPGHGLLLWLAARDADCGEATGWDISETSLEATRRCLDSLGVDRPVRLQKANVLEPLPKEDRFDSIVVSEILEHLEAPGLALRHLAEVLEPETGRIFVNMPVNSPAPDHIFLLREPEEVIKLVEDAGLTVHESAVFPATGYTEAQARRHSLTMSVALIATR